MITNINKTVDLNSLNAKNRLKTNNSLNSFDTNRKFGKATKKDIMSSFEELVQHRDSNLDKLKGKHIEEDVKLKSPFEELPISGINSFINSIKPSTGNTDFISILAEFSDNNLITDSDNAVLDNAVQFAMDKPVINPVLDSGLSKLEQSILNKNVLSETSQNALKVLDKFSYQESIEANPIEDLLNGKSIELNSKRPIGKGIGEQLSDELLKLGIKVKFEQSQDNTVVIKGLELENPTQESGQSIQDLLKNIESSNLFKGKLKISEPENNEFNTDLKAAPTKEIKLELNKQFVSSENSSDLNFAGGKEQNTNSSEFSFLAKLGNEISTNNNNTIIPNSETIQRTKLEELPQTIVKFVAETPANGSSQATLHLNPDNLGNVKIEITLVENSVHLKISAESEEAKQSIAEHLSSLKDKLAENGLKTENIDLRNQNESQNFTSENPQKRQDESEARRKYIEMMRRMQERETQIPLETNIIKNS